MGTAETRDAPLFPQRELYDTRFRASAYDNRSQVRILTAESKTLEDAVHRAISANPDARKIKLLDVGYGTGRVTNSFLNKYRRLLFNGHSVEATPGAGSRTPLPLPSLEIFAYDISAIGLQRSESTLVQSKGGKLWRRSLHQAWDGVPREGFARISRLVQKKQGREVAITFVRGDEAAGPELVGAALLGITEGPVDITTSWYSFLGHIPSRDRRDRYFRALGDLTGQRGEIVLSVAATGDLREEQEAIRAGRSHRREEHSGIFETSQDLTYETELGQANFWHVFGEDLGEHMSGVTHRRQHWWIEAIRHPDEEFRTSKEEEANFGRVLAMNKRLRKAGMRWTPEDYASCHTVVARRSSMSPVVVRGPYWDLESRSAPPDPPERRANQRHTLPGRNWVRRGVPWIPHALRGLIGSQ